VVHITPEEAAKQSPKPVDDLAKRIAQKPVVFHLKAQWPRPPIRPGCEPTLA